MTDVILSNPTYALYFSKEQLRHHNRLLFIGATFAQLFDHSFFNDQELLHAQSIVSLLKQCTEQLSLGQTLAQEWHRIAKHLTPIYDQPKTVS